jgi:hypothetical protein
MYTNNNHNKSSNYETNYVLTLEEPQHRQKCTSKGEPGFTQTGVLRGKNIANLENRQSLVYNNIRPHQLSQPKN